MNNGKIIIFDFDGTLTKGPNSWKTLWESAGLYTGNESLYRALYLQYINGVIDHQEWCDKTCACFKFKKLTKNKIIESTNKNIHLIPGAKEFISQLKNDGYGLMLASGAPDIVIKTVLGDSLNNFDAITSNKMIYDDNGRITHIQGTKYDFEGKKDFINMIAKNTNTPKDNILFIGNDYNDISVHKSGCRTICINPKSNVDSTFNDAWDCVINRVNDYKGLNPEYLFELASKNEMAD